MGTFKLLASHVKVGPLFTEQDLIKDLSRVLQKKKPFETDRILGTNSAEGADFHIRASRDA
jgi:hypothetical protein